MPFWRTYYHLVWGTRSRKELITATVEPVLHQYLTNKAVENGLRVYAINGWYEHVHMVVSIPPKLSVANAVKGLKGASSYYINEQNLLTEKFAWQRGYGVLTIGESQLEKAVTYVERQKERHQENTTNGWLERMNVEDEGPKSEGIAPAKMPHRVGESSMVYDIDDPFPF